MRHPYRLLATLLIAGSAWTASLQMSAAADLDAEGYVRGLRDDVVETLNQTPPRSAERESRLRRLFLDTFDTSTIAERVLGEHWQALDPEERQRYVKAVPAYLAMIYAGQFASYHSQSFDVVGSRDLDNGETAVQTVVQGAGMLRPMPFEVDVWKGDGGYRVRDVAIGGVSVLATKRDEFDSFLHRENTEELIAMIEEYTAE